MYIIHSKDALIITPGGWSQNNETKKKGWSKSILKRNDISSQSSYTKGDLKFDFIQRSVTSKGKEIRLTPLEYNLLRALVLNADKVLTHYYLLSTIWGSEYEREKEYLREYIHHLRAKLEPDPSIPRYITTVPGVGYQFRSAA